MSHIIKQLKNIQKKVLTSATPLLEIPDFVNLKNEINNSEMLVNASSIGMSPDNDSSPVPAELLTSKIIVFDIVYNPNPTRLLREAQAVGAKTIDGIEMLVQQGAISFEIWTGIKAPVDIMRQSVLEQLQNNEK